MPVYLDPASLSRLLVPRRSGPGDYAVSLGDMPFGRITRRSLSGGRQSWHWTITGPRIQPGLMTGQGDAVSFEAAEAAMRRAFEVWLAWADGQEAPVAWEAM